MTSRKRYPKDILYQLYEYSVQDPDVHIDFFDSMFRDLFREKPLSLREDFCGTFWISSEWVKGDPKRTAICLDLDSEPLSYGKRHHLAKMTPAQRKRLRILRQNVVSVTSPKVDIVVAGNFSFNIFKEFTDLVEYFRCVRKSLRTGGAFILELAGGPGMIEQTKERRKLKKDGKPWFQYTWDQQSYNPINHHVKYAIHFKMANGRVYDSAFEYDWRLWTIPELRLALQVSGFDSRVYWEQEDKVKDGTCAYLRAEEADNDYAWICYLVGF